ncbi:MAG: hypothetical protein JEZ07_13895 [Phycisphaerae bacterium]|nr:hypothetical protein [Phycisphaerae bacterium]
MRKILLSLLLVMPAVLLAQDKPKEVKFQPDNKPPESVIDLTEGTGDNEGYWQGSSTFRGQKILLTMIDENEDGDCLDKDEDMVNLFFAGSHSERNRSIASGPLKDKILINSEILYFDIVKTNKGARATIKTYDGKRGGFEMAMLTHDKKTLAVEAEYLWLKGNDYCGQYLTLIKEEFNNIPVGDYSVNWCTVNYGSAKPYTFNVGVNNVKFKVESDKVAKAVLLPPKLKMKINVVGSKDKFDASKQYQTGAVFNFDMQLKNSQGQEYNRFYYMPKNSKKSIILMPKVTITDSAGKMIAEKTLEYG